MANDFCISMYIYILFIFFVVYVITAHLLASSNLYSVTSEVETTPHQPTIPFAYYAISTTCVCVFACQMGAASRPFLIEPPSNYPAPADGDNMAADRHLTMDQLIRRVMKGHDNKPAMDSPRKTALRVCAIYYILFLINLGDIGFSVCNPLSSFCSVTYCVFLALGSSTITAPVYTPSLR